MSSVVQEKPNKRTASKAARRAQLIQATIRSIANDGLADTTIATVASEAGVSQGLINLHFQSKERLLLETLRYVADEYKETWEKALESAGADPRERLEALLAVDYRPVALGRVRYETNGQLGGRERELVARG